jgi:hypothetical protein
VSAELIRAEFDKPPDADFFTLPFPRIQEAPWRPPFREAVRFSKYPTFN